MSKQARYLINHIYFVGPVEVDEHELERHPETLPHHDVYIADITMDETVVMQLVQLVADFLKG